MNVLGKAFKDRKKAEAAAKLGKSATAPAGVIHSGFGRLEFDPNKWNFLFGRATGRQHNLDRTKQLAGQMERLGIKEIPEHKKLLVNHWEEVAQKYPVIDWLPAEGKTPLSIEKHSFFTGPSGVTMKFETYFEALPNGSLKFMTSIIKELKAGYSR